jgi:hypothetical protein
LTKATANACFGPAADADLDKASLRAYVVAAFLDRASHSRRLGDLKILF